MPLSETLFSIVNYFHKDGKFNRITFGVSTSSSLFKLIKWRATDLFLLFILFILYIIAYHIEPFQRQFYINDLTISHPFAEVERVTGSQLFFYAVWTPFAIICMFGLIVTKPKNKIYVTYVSLIGLGLSVFSTSVLTDILKNFIGRHRPDFLARCVPREDAPINVLVLAKDVCTTNDLDRLHDGFRTTPSGHSSISFAGLFYLSLWLSGQLVIKHELTGGWRTLVSFLPTLGAILIALSRTEDYRHHFVDVLTGSAIGLAFGHWSYFRIFPGLSHAKCYEPLILVKEEEEQDSSTYDYNKISEEV